MIWIISEDINFETSYLEIYFSGKTFINDMTNYYITLMRKRYDPDIKIKNVKHYMINDNIGKIIIKYRDCSCLLTNNKNSYITKEIFFRKLKKYQNYDSWKNLNSHLMVMQNLEKT